MQQDQQDKQDERKDQLLDTEPQSLLTFQRADVRDTNLLRVVILIGEVL